MIPEILNTYADQYSKIVWENEMKKFNDNPNYFIGCNDVSDYVMNAIINGGQMMITHPNKSLVDKVIELIDKCCSRRISDNYDLNNVKKSVYNTLVNEVSDSKWILPKPYYPNVGYRKMDGELNVGNKDDVVNGQ